MPNGFPPTTSRSGSWQACGCGYTGGWSGSPRAGCTRSVPGTCWPGWSATSNATQELFLRGVGPPLAAAVVTAGAVAAVWLLLSAPAGIMLAAGMAAGGILVPWLAFARARRSARCTASARGGFSASLTDVLAGAADLHAFGACDDALAGLSTADRDLATLARGSGSAEGLGAGLGAGVAGVTVWVVLLLGVAAVAAGPLSRVPLAAAVLTALAAFEAVAPLPTAAISLGQARAPRGGWRPSSTHRNR